MTAVEEKARGAEYLFLGQAFLSPDPARLREVLQELNAEEFPVAEFDRVLAAVPPEELEREYVRLFLSPAGAECPPWQSVYEAEPRLMGEPHWRALEWYRSAGLQPSESEPADHVGLLLMFYGQLLATEAEEVRIQAFRDQHMAWVPAFCGKVLENTVHPFFRALATTTRELVG